MTREKLLSRIMEIYDRQSFNDPVARQLVYDLMRDGLNDLSNEQIDETARKWFSDEHRV